ncbi:hypothetical protein ACLQ85_00050 [Gallibacterium anatis]|uniref:hypothetical protein n=1 Tax=Gallibacterium anatis TaxID=750 RepID=UPI0039FD2070
MDIKDLKIYRGDDTIFTVRIEALPNFSLQEAELKMTLKSNVGNETLTLSNESGSILGLDDFTMQLIFSHNLTKNVKAVRWRYDCQMRKAGCVRTLFAGKITIEPDITE